VKLRQCWVIGNALFKSKSGSEKRDMNISPENHPGSKMGIITRLAFFTSVPFTDSREEDFGLAICTFLY
jgi:hypothetical protein